MSLPTIAFALSALVCAWGLVEGFVGRTARGGMLLAAGVASVCVLITAGAVAFVVVVAALPVLESRRVSGTSARAPSVPDSPPTPAPIGWWRASWVGLAVLGLAGLFGSLGSRLYVTYGADVGPFAPWGEWTSVATQALGQQVLAIAALSWIAAVAVLGSRRDDARQ